MAINLSEMRRLMWNPEAWRAETERWAALSPAQQKAEQAASDARWEAARKHIAFLDYCVAKKIDPNLVLPIAPKR